MAIVLGSTMYNMFVDEDVLSTIHEVAGRLTASAVSSAEWALTELGSFVHFTDEHSQVCGFIRGGKTELVMRSMQAPTKTFEALWTGKCLRCG